MVRKCRFKPQDASAITAAKIEKLEAIKASVERSARIEDIRIKAVAAQELCMLTLATQLLTIKHDFQLSWQGMETVLGFAAEATTLYKVANRTIHLTGGKYRLVTLAINVFREKNELEAIVFPTWQDWRANY